MKIFSITLLSILLVDVSSTVLRGSSHRHLSQTTTCKLYIEDIQYKTNNDRTSDTWVCELTKEDSRMLGGLQYLEIEGTESIMEHAVPGESTMTLSKAIVDIEDPKIYIPVGGLIEVRNNPRGTDTTRVDRDLGGKTGVLTTLVIRISDSNDIAPTSDVSQLENDFFDDESCLKTRYKACSYGKLEIEPFSGITETGVKVNNGVVDVKINFDLSTNNHRNMLQQAAVADAIDQLGDFDTYDLVAFVFPPGTGDWLAYAFIGSRFSFYNDEAASSVSVQVHEVSHNLGLAHSGDEGGSNYGDQTGYMGASYGADDMNLCFNPAKNYQLGWYDDKVTTVNPLDSEPVKEFILNGVADYNGNDDALIVVRLQQIASDQDYYIGYNRQAGINEDTYEDKNLVTIVRKEKGLPTEYGESKKVASLFLGQSYVIENFNGERGRHVEIKFATVSNGNEDIRDAAIEVIDVYNRPETPTPTPLECEMHTIEITTDDYPEDNRFVILDNEFGTMVAQGPGMTQKRTLYTTELCLPYNKSYKFILYDQYEDGICCKQGPGSYRALDSQGNVLFSREKLNEKFSVKVEHFQVGTSANPITATTTSPTIAPVGSPTAAPTRPSTAPPAEPPTESPTAAPTRPPTASPTEPPTAAPTRPPTTPPTEPPTASPTRPPTTPPTPIPTAKPTMSSIFSVCKDKKGKFNIKSSGKGKKKNCKWIKKKKKCDNTFGGKPLW
eukprot:CAMPEP_0172360084 /NCGR_PEP_ID=MMETSP1060-20121228/4171_1 /TAXON_ID=37318 /ORGANISM="Pseudo-nitzschia pungens, Strain cf. cingulata" /LENGTH=722 /DNA_ID=CAMNT_0013081965 /DNA_START=21 /DNA_END=2186 /DNA_ORIENTATION=-